ncbi:hypothetical protein BaRGS_00014024 [Batillaria attramentaria]|uniref:Uncharacterized protein n=1 Tax=Batillaria attramentaria TaxID=370345 RepID=A0ABD0L5P2_9CAEN
MSGGGGTATTPSLQPEFQTSQRLSEFPSMTQCQGPVYLRMFVMRYTACEPSLTPDRQTGKDQVTLSLREVIVCQCRYPGWAAVSPTAVITFHCRN